MAPASKFVKAKRAQWKKERVKFKNKNVQEGCKICYIYADFFKFGVNLNTPEINYWLHYHGIICEIKNLKKTSNR